MNEGWSSKKKLFIITVFNHDFSRTNNNQVEIANK